MAQIKLQADGLNLADTFAFTGTVTGAGGGMTTYRQELRDLPSGLDTVDKVANVTWPTKP